MPRGQGPAALLRRRVVAVQPAAAASLRGARRHPDHADRRGRDGRRRRGTRDWSPRPRPTASSPRSRPERRVPVDSPGLRRGARARCPEQLAAAHELAGELPSSSLPDPARDRRHRGARHGRRRGSPASVLQAVGTATLPVPVTVLKQYRTPAFVDERTLAFALSYSGDTEETVEMARGALAAGATLVAISRGGELARLAAESGSLHVPCPDDVVASRLALGALVAPLFVVLFRIGMMPEAHASLFARAGAARAPARPVPAVGRGRAQPRPGAGPAHRAHDPDRLRRAADSARSPRCGGSSRVNENAKAPAFWNAYPELDHNEVCGWGQHGDVTRQVLHAGRVAPRARARAARAAAPTRPGR